MNNQHLPTAPLSVGATPIHQSIGDRTLLAHTVEIVGAYVSRNPIQSGNLPDLIKEVHTALSRLSAPPPVSAPIEELRPAVAIKKSIGTDYLICLEDGKRFKSLKRHLATHYGLSPEQYRERWGLPADYPMVAPSYSETRSRLAKDHGLGRGGKAA